MRGLYESLESAVIHQCRDLLFSSRSGSRRTQPHAPWLTWPRGMFIRSPVVHRSSCDHLRESVASAHSTHNRAHRVDRLVAKIFARHRGDSLKKVEAIRATGASFMNVSLYGVAAAGAHTLSGFSTTVDSNLRKSRCCDRRRGRHRGRCCGISKFGILPATHPCSRHRNDHGERDSPERREADLPVTTRALYREWQRNTGENSHASRSIRYRRGVRRVAASIRSVRSSL